MKNRYLFPPANCFKLGLAFAFFIVTAIHASAQNAPAIQWDKSIGGSGREFFHALKQTSDGGYILGGPTESGLSGDKTQPSRGMMDYWIVKLNASGNKMWDKTFGGNGSDILYTLQQTSDGGYVLGGVSNSGISGDKSQASKGGNDYWILKLDGNGNKVWDKTYGGNYDDLLRSLQQTADGGYILGGHSTSGISGDKTQPLFGNSDYWVVKLDQNGNKLWDKTYGGSGTDLLKVVQQTTDGGYILGGSSRSGIDGNKTAASQGLNDYWVIKVDASGTKQWEKAFGGIHEEDLKDIKQTTGGGYIVGGNSSSSLSGNKSQSIRGITDFWVLKLDSNGNKIWDKVYGGSEQEEFGSIQQTPDGGFILGGSSKSSIGYEKSQAVVGDSDYWLLKINSNGTKIWDKTIGTGLADQAGELHPTADGGFIIGADTYAGINGDKTQPSKGNNDFWIIKLGYGTLGTQKEHSSCSISIHPNPSHGKFNLHLSGLTSLTAEVTVTNLLGRVVLQQQFKATNAQLSEEIVLPNAKGMYLLQLKAGDQITTRKIVVE